MAPPISTAVLVIPPFLFYIFKGDLTMKACARVNEVLNAGYFLNGLLIFVMTSYILAQHYVGAY